MSYLISLGTGIVVGLLYYASRVQSPAPPLIALAGLLGIVIGEHAIPVVQAQWQAHAQVGQAAAAQPAAARSELVASAEAGAPNDPQR